MPPPNVTGELHLGHALTASIEDLLTRWHRMRGDATLWLPGRDHAGIAGQLVVERELATEGKTRHDLGPRRLPGAHVGLDGALRREDHIAASPPGRLRRLGTRAVHDGRWSVARGPDGVRPPVREGTDLSRRADHELVPALRHGPVGPRGSAPRGAGHARPTCATHSSRFLARRKTEYIQIATTRPETILADTAIAVHPEDERFTRIVGRQAIVPSVERPVPIVADEVVERGFGTGAVKVTPGHDPTDFEIGQRHNLPMILVIGLDGKMNESAGPRYAGMPVMEARGRASSTSCGSAACS